MDEKILSSYHAWCAHASADPDLSRELAAMAQDEAALSDAFYRDLAFGTGGLRGVIGAGTNRMNVYTVAKASQGLANYVVRRFSPEARRIAVSYDSRIKSDLFARVAAGVFAANGISVFIYPHLMPTPCLSYAVRALGCAAGVMVTASHNPVKYNGYKVYGSDGCQITTEAADEALREIERLDIFADVKQADFDACLADGSIQWIPDSVYDNFTRAVRGQSVLTADDPIDRDVSIVYTPLNGTGLQPVTRALRESGFTRITVVPEQEQPDGHFPTCPYPNPEIREAMALGIACAQKHQADLLLATDPDCDRTGIAVRNAAGEYVLLTGNETGMLLLDFICARRAAHHAMPSEPVMIKTIVTTNLADAIAKGYGVNLIEVLTGFKYIGQQILGFENSGKGTYLFGFEESYGCLIGTHARDKDAIVATMALCEAAAYYKKQGKTLWDQMLAMYEEFGYYKDAIQAVTMKGIEGLQKIQEIMTTLRQNPPAEFAGHKVTAVRDYKLDEITDLATGEKKPTGLPNSNVLYYELTDDAWVCVRPSGTEPKIKFYFGVKGTSLADADEKSDAMGKAVLEMVDSMK